jgi:hypothetical protein
MNNNKRQRTDEEDASPAPSPATTARVPKLRLSDELAIKLGTRYCTDNELVTLMLSQKMCSRVLTFEVKATLMGDLNEWMTITLDDDHASTADVTRVIAQAKGIRPATQELFWYDKPLTGTEGSGRSGHSTYQEDAALVEEGFVFEGPCSLLVSVNESYAVVLEGQEGDEARHRTMGVYERVNGKEVGRRGVWQALGGIDRFLCYSSSGQQWIVSNRENMKAGNGKCVMYANSTAATPDQVTEQWQVHDDTDWVNAPELRVRVCSSVEKHAAERMEHEQQQALVQANQSRRLVVERLLHNRAHWVGVYELMEGKVVNRRAVWQKQAMGTATTERFLYYSAASEWMFSSRREMEGGGTGALMTVQSAALTPDQARPSELWNAHDGTKYVVNPKMQVRQQQTPFQTSCLTPRRRSSRLKAFKAFHEDGTEAFKARRRRSR